MSRYNAHEGRPRRLQYGGSNCLEIHASCPISAYRGGTKQGHVTIRGFEAIGGFGGRSGQALAYWGGSHVVIEHCEFVHAASHPRRREGRC